MLLIGIVATNMLGLFGLGGYLVYSIRAGAQAPAAAGESEESEEEEPGELGPMIEFESMVVNLREADADHYLKLTFQLEVASEEALPEAQLHLTPFRDGVLMYLTSLSTAEVAGPEGADQVRDHLLEIAAHTMGAHTVRHLYFTEYLVQ